MDSSHLPIESTKVNSNFGLRLDYDGSSDESEPGGSSQRRTADGNSSVATGAQTDPISAVGLVVCCFCHGQMEAKLPVTIPKVSSRHRAMVRGKPIDADTAERLSSRGSAEVSAVKRPRGRPPRNGLKQPEESSMEGRLRARRGEREMKRTTRGSLGEAVSPTGIRSLSAGSGTKSPRRIGHKRNLKMTESNLDDSDDSDVVDDDDDSQPAHKAAKIVKSPSSAAAKRIKRSKYPVFGAQKRRKLCLAARRRVAQREAKKAAANAVLKPIVVVKDMLAEKPSTSAQTSVVVVAEKPAVATVQPEEKKVVEEIAKPVEVPSEVSEAVQPKPKEVESVEKAQITAVPAPQAVVTPEKDRRESVCQPVVVKLEQLVMTKPPATPQPQSPPLSLELSRSSGLSPGPNRTHCAVCDTYIAHLKYHVWARHCARMPYGCLQCDFRSWCQSYVVKHAKNKHSRASNALVSKPTIEMQNEYFKFYGLCFGQRVTHKMLSPGPSGVVHRSPISPNNNSHSIADRLRPQQPKIEESLCSSPDFKSARSDAANGSSGKSSREIHKISCRVCNERVSKAYITLSQHVWHHCTEFPFGCSICGWKDLKSTAVEQHMKSSHSGQAGRVIPPSKQLKDEFSGKFSDCFTVTTASHSGSVTPVRHAVSSGGVAASQPSFNRSPRQSTSSYSLGVSKFPTMSMKKSLAFGPKFLQCELCDKKIMRKSTFSHAKTHLPTYLPKTFQCPYCSFGSHTNTYDVTFHVRSAHPGMNDPIINRSTEHRDEAIHVKSLCFPSLSGGIVQRSATVPVTMASPVRSSQQNISHGSSSFTPIVRRSPFGGSRRLPEKTRNCQVCKKKTGWSSWRVHVFKHLFHNCGIARFDCLACPYKTCWHEAIQNHCTGNMGKDGHPLDTNHSYRDNTDSLKLEFDDMLERCFPDFHTDTGGNSELDQHQQQQQKPMSNGNGTTRPTKSEAASLSPFTNLVSKSSAVQKVVAQEDKPPRAYSAGFYKVSPMHMTGRNTCLCKQCNRYIDPHTIKRHVYFHLHQDAKVSRFTCNHCSYRSCWSFMIQKHCKKASLKNHHPANSSFSDNSELIQGDYDVMALKCFPHVLPMPSGSNMGYSGDYGDESEDSEERSEANETEPTGDYIEPQKYFQNAAEMSNNIFAISPSVGSVPVTRIRSAGGPVNSRASSISRAAVARGLDKLVCCQCGDSINTAPSSIDYHVWKKHCQRLPWSCELCGTRDVYPSWIKRHMDSRHGGAGGDPIPPEEELKTEFLEMFDLCFDYPSSSAPKPSSLAGPSGSASSNTVSADSVRCEKCHKVVLRRSSNKHIKWHMDRNLFECPYCPYGSKAVSSDVRNHLKLSHPEREQRIVNHLLEYQEEICALKVSCFPTLNSKSPSLYNGTAMSSGGNGSAVESSGHRQVQDESDLDSAENRLCNLCKKVMNRKSWKPHVFSHMFNDCGIPRYECKFCSYKTCWMFTIKEHCRNRSGKDHHPLNCSYKDNTDALGMEYDDMVEKCYPSYDQLYSVEPSAMVRFSEEEEEDDVGDNYGDEVAGSSAQTTEYAGETEFAEDMMEDDDIEDDYGDQME